VSAGIDLSALDFGALKWAGFGCVALGSLGASFLTVANRDGLPYRTWARYVSFLESKLRLMFITTSGHLIAVGQVFALVALLVYSLTFRAGNAGLLVLPILAGPAVWIEQRRAKRLLAMEAQLNGFALGLANALKATPSLGDAFRTLADLTAQPLQEEILYAVKAMRFGASLEQALILLASRIGSPNFDMVISSLLIGRNVGGDLPTILERTASSMREMTRLEDLVRSKTAEGRVQIWVLALFPLLLMFGLSSLMPDYFTVMTSSFVGYALSGVAAVLWVASILLGRKIMAVEI
jgi:tight adherence protein B